MPDIPPNIKESNEITAVILAELYKSHPEASHHRDNEDRANSRCFSYGRIAVRPNISGHGSPQFHWLASEGFITQMAGPTTAARCTLTARSLGGFKALGTELVQVTEKIRPRKASVKLLS